MCARYRTVRSFSGTVALHQYSTRTSPQYRLSVSRSRHLNICSFPSASGYVTDRCDDARVQNTVKLISRNHFVLKRVCVRRVRPHNMFALQEFYASSGLTQTILCDTSSNGTYVREPADGSEYKFVGAGRNHLLVNNARIAISECAVLAYARICCRTL
jgi:hypothetical protein